MVKEENKTEFVEVHVEEPKTAMILEKSPAN